MTFRLPGALGALPRLGEALQEATHLARPLARQWVQNTAQQSQFMGGLAGRASGGAGGRGRVDVGQLAQALGRMTLSTGAQQVLGAVLGRHGGLAGAAGLGPSPYGPGMPPGPYAQPVYGFRPFMPQHAFVPPWGQAFAMPFTPMAVPPFGPQAHAQTPFTAPGFQPFTARPPVPPRPATPPRPTAQPRPSASPRPASPPRPAAAPRPAFADRPATPAPLHAGSTKEEKKVAGLHFMGLGPRASDLQILGLSASADGRALTKAYRERQRRFHPDKNGNSLEANEASSEIGRAYRALQDRLQKQGHL